MRVARVQICVFAALGLTGLAACQTAPAAPPANLRLAKAAPFAPASVRLSGGYNPVIAIHADGTASLEDPAAGVILASANN